MRLLRRRTRLVAISPAWRGALWRWRHAFLAVALLSAVLLLADVLAPVPAGRGVVALVHDIPAGRDLTPADLTLRPDGSGPESSFTAVEDVTGRSLAVGLPAGTVLTAELLVGPGLARQAPKGHLLIPVSIADPGSRALAQIGTIVTLLGGSEFGDSVQLAPDVLVLSHFDEPGTTGFVSTSDKSTTLIVAVPKTIANVVVDASARGPLRVAVPTALP